MIDAIDYKTLHVSENGGEAVGGFTWSLHFTWHQTFDREMKRRNSLSDYIRLVLDATTRIQLLPALTITVGSTSFHAWHSFLEYLS